MRGTGMRGTQMVMAKINKNQNPDIRKDIGIFCVRYKLEWIAEGYSFRIYHSSNRMSER